MILQGELSFLDHEFVAIVFVDRAERNSHIGRRLSTVEPIGAFGQPVRVVKHRFTLLNNDND